MIDEKHVRMARPLLQLIRKHESGDSYLTVWGGINRQHRPPKPLTDMTIGEVLAWQDRIDPLYMSEAAGAYQFMNYTLRDVYRLAGLSSKDLFSVENQDKLAVVLLARRGFLRYLAGTMDAESFANELAKEWASLPVVTGKKKGLSYYAGDGLNKAHASVSEVMEAVRAAREVAPVAPSLPVSRPQGKGALIAALAALGAVIFAFLKGR